MDSNTIIAAGIAQSAGTVTLNHTRIVKVRASVAAVVTFNGQNISVPVDTFYLDLEIDAAPSFTVVSGTIDWIALA